MGNQKKKMFKNLKLDMLLIIALISVFSSISSSNLNLKSKWSSYLPQNLQPNDLICRVKLNDNDYQWRRQDRIAHCVVRKNWHYLVQSSSLEGCRNRQMRTLFG